MKLIFTIRTLLIAVWDFVSRFTPEEQGVKPMRQTKETSTTKGRAK